jgi:hypothetical protein
MILLKKPYKPTTYTGLSATFNVYGKSFMRLEAVYLSGAPLQNTTFYNPFSAVPRLSATYPGFNGFKLPLSAYSTNFDNTITIKVPAPITPGYINVIAQNPAGYGTITQYVIKELYTGLQDLLTLRPWANGIQVLSGEEVIIGVDNQMLTINGDSLLTITGDNIVSI